MNTVTRIAHSTLQLDIKRGSALKALKDNLCARGQKKILKKKTITLG